MHCSFKVNSNIKLYLPAILVFDENVSNASKILYCVIQQLAFKKGYCYASNAYLADIVNQTKTTITRNIKQLKENGYVKVKYAGKYNSGRMIFIVPPEAVDSTKNVYKLNKIEKSLSDSLTTSLKDRGISASVCKNSTENYDGVETESELQTAEYKNVSTIVKNDYGADNNDKLRLQKYNASEDIFDYQNIIRNNKNKKPTRTVFLNWIRDYQSKGNNILGNPELFYKLMENRDWYFENQEDHYD